MDYATTFDKRRANTGNCSESLQFYEEREAQEAKDRCLNIIENRALD